MDVASVQAESGVELLGRDDELAQLYAVIGGIGQRGGALVVRGEAGIGKSALLEAASARAREREVTVVSTTGTEPEARLAFAGLHRLLVPFLDGLDRLPEPQRAALETVVGRANGQAPDPFLVGLATLGLLTDSEPKRPLLLVVEDAQWLDGPSAEVLGFVARRLEHEPVIVLFALREGVASSFDEAGLPELPLDGLDDEPAKALLESTSPDLPAHLAARVLDEAAGNPLALIELPPPPPPGPTETAPCRYRGGSSRRSRRGSAASTPRPAACSYWRRWKTASFPRRREPCPGSPRWRPGSARSRTARSGSGIH